MIKLLQRKFIAVNVIALAIVCFGLFGTLYLGTVEQYEAEIEKQIDEMIETPGDELNPFFKGYHIEEHGYQAALILLLDSNNKPTRIYTQNLTINEEGVMDLLNKIERKKHDSGYLKDYNFYYKILSRGDGTILAGIVDKTLPAIKEHFFILYLRAFLVCLAFFLIVNIFLSRWALTPVKKAWERETQFIADASHELKTPLSVILANLAILRKRPDSTIAEEIKWLDTCDEEARRMKELIEEMLSLAHGERRLNLEGKKVDFSDLLYERILAFEAVALEHGVNIVYDDLPEHCYLKGDEKALKEVVTILLDNACRYALPNSSIRVAFEQKPKFCRLSVSNLCEGIDRKRAEKLFERFYRVDPARSSESGGHGLGLAIAKVMVEQHHGTIQASVEDQTITFTIKLPLQ